MGKRIFISSLISTGITGVYKITNPTNKKIYIGSGFDIRERWGQHCRAAVKDLHFGLYFENALRKNGPEHFVWEIVEVVDISDLCRKDQRIKIRERILEAEQRWLDSEQPFWWTGKGYNINPSAYSRLGTKQTGKAAAGVPRPYRQGVKISPMTGRNKKGPKNFKTKLARFTSPDGKVFTRPLSWFCKSRGLNKGAVAALARGTYKLRSGKLLHIYKGWKAEYI